MSDKRVIVVRHGETQWNVQGKYQGHMDSPLTSKGMQQAKDLAARFKNYKIEAVYTSDLGRAYHTAKIIAEALNLGLIQKKQLRERHLGIFQGLEKTAIEQKFPLEYQYYLSQDENYAISGGESRKQFQNRCLSFFETLVREYSGKHDILVVTHGGVLITLVKHVLEMPMDRLYPFRLFNASVNVFIWANGKWLLETLGDNSHLQSVTAFPGV